MNEQIVVRDRRQKHQFSIHNLIIDEYLPIIGLAGYTIYSLYVRMASRESERCYPGYSLISAHLSIGRGSISNYNKLLAWCRLIHIQYGNCNRPNEYYILDISHVTPILLDEIRAHADKEPESEFKRTVLRRLENWRPMCSHWGSGKNMERPIIIHPAQLRMQIDSPVAEHPGSVVEHPGSVVEHPGSVVEHPGSVVEHPVQLQNCNNPNTTIQNNNPNETINSNTDTAAVVKLLEDFGIEHTVALELSRITDYETAAAWLDYAETQECLQNPAGFVISRIRMQLPAPVFVRQSHTDWRCY